MRVSGFTIIRNGVQFGYPFVESIRSLLPLVDEMVVMVGDSEDDTLGQVRRIGSDKLVIAESVWDPNRYVGGEVMAHQTNLALDRCTGDWCFYLQADEVIHEDDHDRIRAAMQRTLPRRQIEGLSFRYRHFVGDYAIHNPLPYRRQVRIVRNGIGIRSIGDACGFGRNGRKLRARFGGRSRPTGAWIYHYGWVRPPTVMTCKTEHFAALYTGSRPPPPKGEKMEAWLYDLSTCVPYQGTHPAVMRNRIEAKDWETPPFLPVPRWRNRAWWRGTLRKAGLLKAP